MSIITTCECGAQVRLPADVANRAFRCPACKAGIALTIDAKVLSTTRLDPGTPGATCPLCQCAIAVEETAVTCPGCDQIHHRECWAEVGGCGTYGCSQAPAPVKEKAVAPTPLSAWGDKKKCPACGETIKSIALKCRYCGTEFGTVNPMTKAELRQRIRREEAMGTLQKGVVALFVCSLIGCLAPIVLIVGSIVILPRRKELGKKGPFYLVLGYSALALSAVYSILMLFFGLLHVLT